MTLGISHAFEFHKRMSLELPAKISYLKSEDEEAYPKFDANTLAAADKYNNFHDGTVSASLPISITNNLSFSLRSPESFRLATTRSTRRRAVA